ncbi:type II toxin-antitoxin system RelE family toxin [Gordonibacter massiliensis (ex Traore et al. 2017)]|uniref:Type II toxin-antitoxin system RelE/ParE family toxin n=1 Tax=Gordonibacter massiliensis (ex Traore et al. 2017) TaxID=1841863 RepID=A0A842JAM8_9ACTN|nr:type II toxin-antitoxin system RelE/ParE family toxin [Gordonibacter massiliensis (ex Traore et al. 2017)]MBC2888903.1 type II toxin-antitoxin system RelE/ParE family toxin [Gordonibacter massiliensis (ex Traore et al. 2017)]
MSWHVIWSKKATKQLLSIEGKQRLLIASWVNDNLEGCANPKAILGAKQIQGIRNGWRYRAGSYRVLARIEDDELLIEVVRAGHRQGVYSNLPDL